MGLSWNSRHMSLLVGNVDEVTVLHVHLRLFRLPDFDDNCSSYTTTAGIIVGLAHCSNEGTGDALLIALLSALLMVLRSSLVCFVLQCGRFALSVSSYSTLFGTKP